MNQKTKPAAAAPTLVKFRTGNALFGDRIEKVAVIRETKAFVYLPGRKGGTERRDGKRTEWTQYHDTWADAHAYLVETAEAKVVDARRRLEKAKGELGNIKGMKPPKESE
jgi:hypothetical protein